MQDTKTTEHNYRDRNPNNSISLGQLIELYENLIKQGKMTMDSAGGNRLETLRRKAFAYRKWIKTPIAKRRHITSPL